MIQEHWLATHPYLRPIAAFHSQIDAVAEEVCTSIAPTPRRDDYLDDFLAGIPLLQNPAAAIDLAPTETMLCLLVHKLADRKLDDRLSEQLRTLQQELQAGAEHLMSDTRVAGDTFAETSCPGLLRHLGWTVLSRYLSPCVSAFESWSARERWLRPYCPTCGSLPAMAQLLGGESDRTRLLSCGCCRTRWPYRRTGCPFCNNQDDHRLAVLAIEGEGGLRIDYCQSCNGYLKTYCGNGNEGTFMADWTSIHIDVAARERGLKRVANSLYEI